jgi:hypothetical protein
VITSDDPTKLPPLLRFDLAPTDKMLSVRYRNTLLTCSALLFVFLATSYLVHFNSNQERVLPGSPEPPPPASSEYKPKYKPAPEKKSYPIIDNFPLAAAAHSAADLPPIAEWNRPPSPHVPEQTPLFIGFTRNWRILQQVVVSYINAGWPPSDIYVIENTGVMDSNKRGLLSLQNPFFLNHTRLNMLGVNILVTPTLLTFAQLQNFYLYTSIDRKWDHYFWSHMDVRIRLTSHSSLPLKPRSTQHPIPQTLTQKISRWSSPPTKKTTKPHKRKLTPQSSLPRTRTTTTPPSDPFTPTASRNSATPHSPPPPPGKCLAGPCASSRTTTSRS